MVSFELNHTGHEPDLGYLNFVWAEPVLSLKPSSIVLTLLVDNGNMKYNFLYRCKELIFNLML